MKNSKPPKIKSYINIAYLTDCSKPVENGSETV